MGSNSDYSRLLKFCLHLLLMSSIASESFQQYGYTEFYIGRNQTVNSYSEAQERCRSMRSTLAVVDTSAIRNFLINCVGTIPASPYSFYIGLTRISNGSYINDTFQWTDGTVLSRAVDEFLSENCVTMGWRYELDPQYKWRHVPCDNWKSRFICQRPIIFESTSYNVLADIMFVLDGSGSVSFSEIINWVEEVLQKFRTDIDQGHTRVGIIVFNHRARIEISLNATLSYAELIRQLNSTRQDGGLIRIGQAIGNATSEFESYGRSNVSQLMIVLTDGELGDDVAVNSQQARERGITLIAIGSGNEYSRDQLLNITGNASNVYEVQAFNLLSNRTTEVLKMIKEIAGIPVEEEQTSTIPIEAFQSTSSKEQTAFETDLFSATISLDAFQSSSSTSEALTLFSVHIIIIFIALALGSVVVVCIVVAAILTKAKRNRRERSDNLPNNVAQVRVSTQIGSNLAYENVNSLHDRPSPDENFNTSQRFAQGVDEKVIEMDEDDEGYVRANVNQAQILNDEGTYVTPNIQIGQPMAEGEHGYMKANVPQERKLAVEEKIYSDGVNEKVIEIEVDDEGYVRANINQDQIQNDEGTYATPNIQIGQSMAEGEHGYMKANVLQKRKLAVEEKIYSKDSGNVVNLPVNLDGYVSFGNKMTRRASKK